MPRRFSNWLQAYIEYTKHLEAPTTFHFWAGVSAIAGALQGKVWFDMGYFKWKPNFFIIYVAPPGIVAKSTTMGQAIPLLREVPGVHFGPDSCTWQALTDSFLDSTSTVDMGDGNLYQTSSITVSISELGTFLDPSNRELVDLLVDLWDGKDVPWTRRTKGEGETAIRNPWLNLIGCTTPGWMAEHFPEYAIQGGFTSRTIFLFADTKRHYTAYPGRILDDITRKLRPQLIEDLCSIAEIAGAYEMEDDAYAWGEQWYQEHWQAPASEATSMAGYRARKQTHVHKLAMVLSAAQRDEMVILKEDLITADRIITSLEAAMPEVFNAVSDTRDVKCAAALVKLVRARKEFPKTEAWKTLFRAMSYDEFERALRAAIAGGYIVEVSNGESIILTYRGPQESSSQPLDTQGSEPFHSESQGTS